VLSFKKKAGIQQTISELFPHPKSQLEAIQVRQRPCGSHLQEMDGIPERWELKHVLAIDASCECIRLVDYRGLQSQLQALMKSETNLLGTSYLHSMIIFGVRDPLQ
jgi:hypothetical protein